MHADSQNVNRYRDFYFISFLFFLSINVPQGQDLSL